MRVRARVGEIERGRKRGRERLRRGLSEKGQGE
jgi:hypothetical protein